MKIKLMLERAGNYHRVHYLHHAGACEYAVVKLIPGINKLSCVHGHGPVSIKLSTIEGPLFGRIT